MATDDAANRDENTAPTTNSDIIAITTTNTTTSVDLMTLLINMPLAQILALSAKSASIDDTIYFLDQASVILTAIKKL